MSTPQGPMAGLIPHLLELRSRLMKAALAVLLVLLALLPFSEKLYALLALPLVERLPKGTHMIATEVTGPFLTPIKLSVVLALLIAMPVVL